MDIFESLEELNISEECFEDIINIVEEYINELNYFTVAKVNAIRDTRTNKDNVTPKDIKKAQNNRVLTKNYIKRTLGNEEGDGNIEELQNHVKKVGDNIIANKGSTKGLPKTTKETLKNFKKSEDNWAKKNPTKSKTGIVYNPNNPQMWGDAKIAGTRGNESSFKNLSLDNVKFE